MYETGGEGDLEFIIFGKMVVKIMLHLAKALARILGYTQVAVLTARIHILIYDHHSLHPSLRNHQNHQNHPQQRRHWNLAWTAVRHRVSLPVLFLTSRKRVRRRGQRQL